MRPRLRGHSRSASQVAVHEKLRRLVSCRDVADRFHLVTRQPVLCCDRFERLPGFPHADNGVHLDVRSVHNRSAPSEARVDDHWCDVRVLAQPEPVGVLLARLPADVVEIVRDDLADRSLTVARPSQLAVRTLREDFRAVRCNVVCGQPVLVAEGVPHYLRGVPDAGGMSAAEVYARVRVMSWATPVVVRVVRSVVMAGRSVRRPLRGGSA